MDVHGIPKENGIMGLPISVVVVLHVCDAPMGGGGKGDALALSFLVGRCGQAPSLQRCRSPAAPRLRPVGDLRALRRAAPRLCLY